MFGSGPQKKQNRLNKALWKAARTGNVVEIRDLLGQGADIDSKAGGRFSWGTSPLNVAALCGETEAVRCLLDAGANVNSPDTFGDRPIRNALFHGNPKAELVELLMRHGADPGQKNLNGVSALSCVPKRRDDIKALLAPKAPPPPPPSKPNPDEIVLCRMLGDRLLQETFNFADRERITLVRAAEGGPVEAITREDFSALQGKPALRRAFEQYARQGGTIPEGEIFPAELLKAKPALKTP